MPAAALAQVQRPQARAYVLASAQFKDGVGVTDDINDAQMTDEKVAG
jgi:hypothetical protein